MSTSEAMTIRSFDVAKATITEYLTLSQKRYLIAKGVEAVIDSADGISYCDPFLKDVFLTMIFMGSYFGCKFAETELEGGAVSVSFDEGDYDYIREHDLLSEIERVKLQAKPDNAVPTELGQKVCRATDDFELFAKLFDSAIGNELSIRNNVADRLLDRFTQDLSPENLKAAQEELIRQGEALRTAQDRVVPNKT